MKEKNLSLERVIFFSDAVVAIAITLLALDLKINHVKSRHLEFHDFLTMWKSVIAFILSFINIASFWRSHHRFFDQIKKMDERLLAINIAWLFFIVVLPFSTTLVSTYFNDTPAMFVYCMNIFIISALQNFLWDYPSMKQGFIDPETNQQEISQIRLYCNLDMLNGLIAIAVSLFSPRWAFILLFTKIPLFVIANIYIRNQIKQGKITPRRKK